ncbi:MAG: FtsX-like permease family protein [Ruminococcaceae bacterium]|nr:FtsX-like permease family protein [Oscillospiraceae bacterium]
MNIKKVFYRYVKEILPFKTAVVAVVISVVASFGVSAVSESGKQIITDEMNAMGMNGLAVAAYNSDGENVTDISLYNNIASMGDIEDVTPVIVNNIEAVFSNGVRIETVGWGVNEQAPEIVSLQITEGRMINRQDIESNAFVCLVDENIAHKVYKRSNICGKQITVTTGNKTAVFDIIGTVKKGSNVLNTLSGDVVPDFIYIPHTTMKNLSVKSSYDQIFFTSNDTEQEAAEFKQKLTEISYRYRNKTISLTNLSQHKKQIYNIADTAFLSLFAVSCVAIVVCGVSVASSVNTAVITKQKDIGIKISMGASRFDIIKEFLLSVLLSCFTGVAAAVIIVAVVFTVAENVIPYRITLDYSLIVISVSATIILAVAFSFIPSFKAAKMPPIKALNRE